MRSKSVYLVSLIQAFLVTYDVATLPLYFLLQWIWRDRITGYKIEKHRPEEKYGPITIERINEKRMRGFKSVDDIFRYVTTTYGSRKGLGHRRALKETNEKQPNGVVFKKIHQEDKYVWMTYHEANARVESLSKALLVLGVRPKDKVIIYSETRKEWFLMAMACFRNNMTIATVYPTLGEEGLVYAMNQCDTEYLFTSSSLLPKIKTILEQLESVTTVVCFESDLVPKEELRWTVSNVRSIPFSEFERFERDYKPEMRGEAAGLQDICVLMFTSGSTGMPKGVMLTHENFVSSVEKLLQLIDEKNTNCYLAYLPLAHIMEMSLELAFLFCGGTIAYSSQLTLTDMSSGVPTGQKGDVIIARPTMVAAVPLVLDRMRKAIEHKIHSKGAFASSLIHYLIRYKLFWIKRGFTTPILNRLLFRKMAAVLGNNLDFLFCGGASLNKETQDFIMAVMNTNVVQGYGLTETSANGAIQALHDYTSGNVGYPMHNTYIKLKDWKEGNYFNNDLPNPRGEILIGGKVIAKGYYKNEELTKKDFTVENGVRYFHTGDIGEILPGGKLRIIDRKKDLVKLQHGEYIALGTIECILKGCPLIDNVCLLANDTHNFTVALIAPNFLFLDKLKLTMGKSHLSIAELLTDNDVLAQCTSIVKQFCAEKQLSKREVPFKIMLCREEWIPTTGLVTASMKIRRKVIEQYYRVEIEQLYRGIDSSLSV